MADEEFDFDALEARIQAAKQAKSGTAPAPKPEVKARAVTVQDKPRAMVKAATVTTPKPAPVAAPTTPAAPATGGPARSESMQAEAAWKNAAAAFERGVADAKAKAQAPSARRDEKMKGLVTGMADRFVQAQPLVQVPRATEWAAQKALDWYETSPTGHAYRAALQADKDRWERADEGREAAYARHRENASRPTDIRSPAVDDLSIIAAAPMPVRSAPPKPTVIDMSGDVVTENGKPIPSKATTLTAAEKRAKLDAVLDMTGVDTDAQVDELWSNPQIQKMLTQ